MMRQMNVRGKADRRPLHLKATLMMAISGKGGTRR